MDLDLFVAAGKALKELGPWGLLLVAGIVIDRLWRRANLVETDAAEKKQALNDRLVRMAERQGELVGLVAKNQASLVAALERTRDYDIAPSKRTTEARSDESR